MAFNFVDKCLWLLAITMGIALAQESPINVALIAEHSKPGIVTAFQFALNMSSARTNLNLREVIVETETGNTFATSKKLCAMLQESVVSVFGPTSDPVARHAMTICDAKELPFIDIRRDMNTQLSTINLHPHPSQLARALKDLIIALDWSGFTIIYETGEYLAEVNELLQMYGNTGPTITVRRYELDLNANYRHVLRRIRNSGETSFVIVGSLETLPELLKQAQQVGLMTASYRYIIAHLDLQTIDLEPYQYCGVNMTGMRLLSPLDDTVQSLAQALSPPEEEGADSPSGPFPVTVAMALVYDGVQLLAETLQHVVAEGVPLHCSTTDTWDKGYTLINYMKTLTVEGITGEVKFDHQGLRTDFSLEIVELVSNGLHKIGNWRPDEGFTAGRPPSVVAFEQDHRSLVNKSFVVITAISEPYGMLKETSAKLEGNDQFEGFGIDLIEELAKKLGFSYTFRLQEDNKYGSLDPVTGKWNGMILEIIEGRADLGITDLTMTSDRESGVDFTIPFMNLGIAILFRKPMKEPPKLFSFMSPFSGEVWLWLGLGYLGVSLSMFILGRISPAEWDNPYPCIEEPTELENQFSFANCLWFSIGALLQQGSELAPKAYSTRTVASFWWFFTLILVSSYTANLAAFLTVESLSSPIENAEDLAANKGGVKFGAKVGGSTFTFFKDAKYPTYQRMYEFMRDNPEYMTSTNAEGVSRVENENYAFLMESTTIEYITERRCSLTQVGSLLDEKGYGIAMRKNWPYRDMLSQAVLELQERGVLSKMKIKWWKEKRGGGACSDTGSESGALALEISNLGGVYLVLIVGSFFAVFVAVLEMVLGVKERCEENKQGKDSDGAAELGIANLGGVYFVLFVGSIFASIYGLMEWLLGIYATTRRNKVSFKAELMDELRFIMQCSGNTKAVKYPKNSTKSSSSSSTSTSSKGSSLSVDSLPTDQLDDNKLHVNSLHNKFSSSKAPNQM